MYASSPRRALTLIELLVVMSIMTMMMSLVLPAVQQVRSASDRTKCLNCLHQIALAIHNHEVERGYYPQAYDKKYPISRSDAGPRRPWTTLILPYLERSSLFDLPGTALDVTIVKDFHCAADWRLIGKGRYLNLVPGALTSYFAVDGGVGGNATGPRVLATDGVMYVSSKTRSAHILDGTSHTIVVGERPPDSILSWGWTFWGWFDSSMSAKVYAKPDNFTYTGCAVPGVYGPGNTTNICHGLHYWSLHSGGANFAFADGSVRFIAYNVDPDFLPKLATRNGAEAVEVP